MADWLNAQGYRTRFGRLFTKDALQDILQNPFYKGDVHYRGQLLRGGKVRRRTEAEAGKGMILLANLLVGPQVSKTRR